MYLARRKMFCYSMFASKESLATYSETLVLLPLKMQHRAGWMVGLTPLGFSAFCSGFYKLLSQKLHHEKCTHYQAGREEEFCDPSVRVIWFKPIWTGKSSPLGKKLDASR